MLTIFSVEPPGYYLQRGKDEKAILALKKIASLNNILRQEKVCVDFQLQKVENPTVSKIGVFDIWRQNRAFSLQSLAIILSYGIMYLVYWGFTLNLALIPVKYSVSFFIQGGISVVTLVVVAVYFLKYPDTSFKKTTQLMLLCSLACLILSLIFDIVGHSKCEFGDFKYNQCFIFCTEYKLKLKYICKKIHVGAILKLTH